MRIFIYIINFIGLIIPSISFAQNLTTNEYYTKGSLRRTIVYDENLNMLNEIYFRQSNSKPIAKIEYKSKDSIKRATFYKEDGQEISYDIDFEKGKYIDRSSGIELRFKNNFIFEGKQIGEHIVANYHNNKRIGPVLQYDSTATGKVLSNKVFAEYEYKIIHDRAYITHTTLHPMYEDTFSLYKGIYCNFNNDILDGNSVVYNSKGKKKVESNFKSGKCLFYNSYDNLGNVISKITGSNGLVNSKVLLNGTVKEFNNNLMWFYSLESVGEIYAEFEHPEFDKYTNEFVDELIGKSLGIKLSRYSNGNSSWLPESKQLLKIDGIWNVSYKIKAKTAYDSLLTPVENITDLRKLLGIPYFYLRRFSFDNYDKDDIAFIPVSSMSTIDSLGIHPFVYNIKEAKDILYYNRSPFFINNDTHLNNVVSDEFWKGTIHKNKWDDNENLLVTERKCKFNVWLKEAMNYINFGTNDNFSCDFMYDMESKENGTYINRNENKYIELFLKSYSDSILKMCFNLYQYDSIPSFKYVLGGYKSWYPNINNEFGFVINSRSNRYFFSLIEDDKKMYSILNDIESQLSFFFEIEKEEYSNWVFKISSLDKTKTYYLCKNEGIDRIKLNNINSEVKNSLKLIYDNFH